MKMVQVLFKKAQPTVEAQSVIFVVFKQYVGGVVTTTVVVVELAHDPAVDDVFVALVRVQTHALAKQSA